ncbi:MAG: SRPBCC family protein [Flavobacteriales bacterium]|nr:SRPBCC family protein [Flavobacteriales bacterium]
MRALKTILIILLALLAIIVVLGLTGTKHFRIERSVNIKAPAETVYPQLSSLRNQHAWSPWMEKDPKASITFEGTDGTVGSAMSWSGNDSVGSGRQEITELVPNKSVRSALHFITPWEAHNTAALDMEVAGDSARVTWSLEGDNNFMMRVMGHFMDMDGMLGPEFEKGLAKLKATTEEAHAKVLAEQADRTVNGYLIEPYDNPELVYVGKHDKKVKWKNMGTFFGTNFPATFAAVGAAKLEMAGAPSGVFWAWNEADQSADLMAGIPVKGGADTKVEGFETHVIPAGRMLKIAYYGDYAKNMPAHEAMDAYIKRKGLTHYGNVIEEYVTDPMAQPDTSKWLTNIYYMVK